MRTTPQLVGPVPSGYVRRAGILTGGEFEGARLRGRVLSGGGDFLTIRADGTIHLDVRAMLETDAGDLIYLTYVGRRKTSAEVAAKLSRGEPVGAEEMYFRTLIQFEASASSLLWLNDILAIGIGSRPPEGPIYEVFELL